MVHTKPSVMKLLYNHARDQIETSGASLSWVEDGPALYNHLSNQLGDVLKEIENELPAGLTSPDYIRRFLSAPAEEFLFEVAANRYWMWRILCQASLEPDESCTQLQLEDVRAGHGDMTEVLVESLIRWNKADPTWMRDFSIVRLRESVGNGQIGKICRYTNAGILLASPHEEEFIVNPILTWYETSDQDMKLPLM